MIQEENNWVFSVQDFGVGLSPERVRDIYSKYAASTKRDSNEQYGAYGLGSKSALGYRDNFYIVSRYNGKQYMYMMHKGHQETELTLLSTTDTLERNGVTVRVPLKSANHVSDFTSKAEIQLSYFDHVYINMPSINPNYTIIKHKLWKYSELYGNSGYDEMHICLDNVYYPIDWGTLGVDNISIPIGLNFSIKDGIVPTPNREQLLMTPSTKNLILSRIAEVGEWFITRANKKNKFKSFKEYIENKDKLHVLTIENKIVLDIPDELESHSLVKFEQPEVDGLPNTDLGLIASKLQYIVADYRVQKVYTDSTGWKSAGQKERKWGLPVPNRLELKMAKTVILVKPNERISPMMMDYIIDTYYDHNVGPLVFAIKEDRIPTNMIVNSAGHIVHSQAPLGTYYTFFVPIGEASLEQIQEIKLIESEYTKDFVDISSIIIDTDWLEERKDTYKKTIATRVSKGQVYLYLPRDSSRSGDYVFDKTAKVDLSDLHQFHQYMIYGSQEQIGDIKEWSNVIHDTTGVKALPLITSATNVKKIEGLNLPNWINVDDLRKKKSRLLSKFATARRIEYLIANNDALFRGSYKLSNTLYMKLHTLKEYRDKNIVKDYFWTNYSFEKGIMTLVENKGWWDMSIYGLLLEVEKELPLLSFFNTLHISSGYKDDQIGIFRELYAHRKHREYLKNKQDE